MRELNRKLDSNEHVHHLNWDKQDDRIKNYELINPVYHGRLHASAITLARFRDELGRFVEHTTISNEYSYPRFRAVLGPAAMEMV
jgi:hypothetical protein